MGIGREAARKKGVAVRDLESDQALQDAVLSVHHATMHTFGGAAVKVIENHLGVTYAKLAQSMMIQLPVQVPAGLGIQGGPGIALPLPGGEVPD
jgi:hypothetical protein